MFAGLCFALFPDKTCTMTAPVLVFFHLAFAILPTRAYLISNETELRRQVLGSYDTRVRPHDVTDVDMAFVPNALSEINIRKQTMTISGWWIMHWHDPRLSWDALTYNISEFHVFEDDVWSPSVVVYNSVDSLSAIDEDTIPIRLNSSGDVEWNPPGILTVSCSTDITFFPFDVQTCHLSLTTFGFTIDQILLRPNPVTTYFYTPNGEWDLLTTFTKTNLDRRASYISFHFEFKRKPMYYCLNLVLPVLLCWVLSLFIFLLPAQSGEKIGYGLTVLLAFVVLMTLLGNRMPTTADHVAYLEVYIELVLVFCTASVAYSILIVAVCSKEISKSNSVEPVPEWLRRFTLFSRNLLTSCLRRRSQPGGVQILRSNEVSDAPDINRTDIGVKSESADKQKGSEEVAVTAITWSDAAAALDSFGLKVYLVLTLVISVSLMSMLVANA